MTDSDIEFAEKRFISDLYEEEYVNELLSDFKFEEPKSILDIYIKERFKDDEDLYNRNIKNRKKEPLFKEKYNVYSKEFKALSNDEKSKYKMIYEQEILNFKRNIEIMKKYIFKGVDENIKMKKTAYQLFLSDELILGLDQGLSPSLIRSNALKKWNDLDLAHKNKYYLNFKYNDTFLDIVQNYNKINSFLLFIYHYFKKNCSNNQKIPSLNKLVELFAELPKNNQLLYEEYSNHFIFLKYKLRDIYDSIHGIKVKTPSGALRIFLQEKAIKNEINNIKDGIDEWNKLSEDEKENYLTKSHLQFLAFKYKELLYDKKISRFLPKDPRSPFHIFMKLNRGIKIPDGYSGFDYYYQLYNNLSAKDKLKYDNIYNKAKENYNNKYELYKNKQFDLPKKPRSSLAFYFRDRLNQLYNENSKLDLDNCINKIFEEWFNNKIDKYNYELQSSKDKKRFERQINEFESLGYYSKSYEEDL